MRKRIFFSLVELMLVIAIIGVLMTLLLPYVRRAGEKGRIAFCVNNLKQLATANTEYAGTYDYFVPARSGGLATGQHWHGSRDNEDDSWDAGKGLLASFLGTSGMVNKCPSIHFDQESDSSNTNLGAGGYGYNYVGVGSMSYFSGYDQGNCWQAGLKPVGIYSLSKTVMFGDCAHYFNNKIVENDRINAPYSLVGVIADKLRVKKPSSVNNNSKFHFRHDRYCNVAWADGHASQEIKTFSWSHDGGDGDDQVRSKSNIGHFGPKDNSLFDPWTDTIPEE